MGKKGSFVAGLLFVLLLLNVSAASISSDNDSYLKGGEIVFRGELEPTQADTVVAKSGLKTVFEETVKGRDDGTFGFVYHSNFLDPSGEWFVSLQESGVSTKVDVEAVPDSAVFVITFASPIPGKYRRTEGVEISLKITYLGEELDFADAAIWGTDGKKLLLQRKGKGLYGLAYEMPYNAPLGDWLFLAVAQKDVNGGSFGGENSIHLSVVQAPIAINVIEPVFSSIEIEQVLRIVVKPLYFNGKAPAKASVFGKIGDYNLLFSPQPDGTFSAEYPTTEFDAGEVVVELLAVDDAGNSGKEKVNVVVGGWFSWFVKKNWPFFVVGIVVALFALIKLRSKLKRSVGLAKLKREKAVEMAKLRKLQEDYFKIQVIDRSMFEERSSELESNIARLDERIRAAEGKKKVIK